MEIYDNIADAYKEMRQDMKRVVSSDYAFLKHIGDVRGKGILDLACGDGHYSRRLKALGAREAVGIDISQKMVDLALREERAAPLGIRYERHDAVTLPVLGSFDIALASFLLHYSRQRDGLFGMCRCAGANLRAGGRLIGINLDPRDPLQPDGRYGSTITCDTALTEGCVIKVVIYDGDTEVCSFDNYHWSQETYEAAFRAAGFTSVRWHPIEISPEGMQLFGEGFWNGYLKRPGLVIFDCRKG